MHKLPFTLKAILRYHTMIATPKQPQSQTQSQQSDSPHSLVMDLAAEPLPPGFIAPPYPDLGPLPRSDADKPSARPGERGFIDPMSRLPEDQYRHAYPHPFSTMASFLPPFNSMPHRQFDPVQQLEGFHDRDVRNYAGPVCPIRAPTPYNQSRYTPYADPQTGMNTRKNYNTSNFANKVAQTWKLSKYVTLRTGYMEGILVLRISDVNELAEVRTPAHPFSMSQEEETQNMCISHTVMLTRGEVVKLSQDYSRIVTTMYQSAQGFDTEPLEFPLGFINLGSSVEPTLKSIAIRSPNLVVLRSWLQRPDAKRIVNGEVWMNEMEFKELGQVLDAALSVFQRFPNNLQSDPTAGVILGVSAELMINMIRGDIGPITVSDMDNMPPKIYQALFKAYNECLNFSFSTALLVQIKANLDQVGIRSSLEMYTLLHQCLNQFPLLLDAMRKILIMSESA
jgi:hypothetical protein